MRDYTELFTEGGLSLDRLRALERFAAAGCSLIKAAHHAPGRAAQYSRQIAELKGFFGAHLTARQGQNLLLTSEGETLVQIVREAFQKLADFKTQCSGLPRRFAIGAGDSLLHWLIIPRLSPVLKKHPDYSFSLHNLQNTEIISGLLDLSLDFGFVRTNQAVQPLTRLPLGVKTYALYIPRTIPGADALVRENWKKALTALPLAAQAKYTHFQRELEKRAAQEKIRISVLLYCESVPEVVRALQTGKYAAILHCFASQELQPEEFHTIRLPFLDGLAPQIALAWNPRLLTIRGKPAEELKTWLGETMKFSGASTTEKKQRGCVPPSS